MAGSCRAYAGIGSRSTPIALAPVLRAYAQRLREQGWTLRSGRARGADSFFEDGAGARAELFIPSGRSGVTDAGAAVIVPDGAILERCLLLASTVHPAWERCSPYARLLHARNVCQIHGARLDAPVAFVVAWAKPEAGEAISGGTRLAWEIAGAANIPRFNLAVESDRRRFEAKLAAGARSKSAAS